MEETKFVVIEKDHLKWLVERAMRFSALEDANIQSMIGYDAIMNDFLASYETYEFEDFVEDEIKTSPEIKMIDFNGEKIGVIKF